MRINYTGHRRQVFCDVKIGETFVLEDTHYIKIHACPISGANCLNLLTFRTEAMDTSRESDTIIHTVSYLNIE